MPKGINNSHYERLAKVAQKNSAVEFESYSTDPTNIGENELIVLNAVKELNGGTMEEIAKLTGMHISRVSVNLDSLIELEYVSREVSNSGVRYFAESDNRSHWI